MLKVTCAIIEKNQQVLITQRGPHKSQALLWEFPGGKIEPSETETDCLIREIEEELNLQVELGLRLTPVEHNYGNFMVNLIPYVCQYKSGTIALREHVAYNWVSAKDLNRYNWCPADLPIVEEYIRRKK
ncbi:(deoxy)nucleoside triphosphate pyrophosphohydrolase [Pontibacter silvestris]|nr:(deoxy)nucleoside triphosphate pyrophosphohydrolase [Pontibacter silvestris]